MYRKKILTSKEPNNSHIIERVVNFIKDVFTPPPPGKDIKVDRNNISTKGELRLLSESNLLDEPLLNN